MDTRDAAMEQEKKEKRLTPEDRELLLEAVDVIKRLVIAAKSLTLYPLRHPVERAALEMLYRVLNNFLSRHGTFSITISQDSLVFGDWVVGKKLESFRNFASTLRNLKIRELGFLPGIEMEELELFIRLLITDPELIELEGGIETQVFVNGINHVAVLESLSREKPEKLEDKKEKAASKEGPVDLFLLLEDALGGFAQRLQELIDLILVPEHLAFNLRHFPSRDKPITDLEQLVEAIFLFLKKASHLLEVRYPSRKNSYYRSMAEALLFLDTDLRNRLLLQELLPRLGEEPFCAVLLSQFTAQEISDILSLFLPEAQELISRTRGLLKLIGFTDGKVDKILSLLKERLVERGDIPQHLIYALDKDPGDAEGTRSHRKLPLLEELVEFFREYNAEDLQMVNAISEMDMELERLVECTPVLLNLFLSRDRIDNLPAVVDGLIENFWDLLEHSQMEMAASLLREFKACLGELDPLLSPFREKIAMTVNEAVSPAAVRSIMKKACQLRDDPQVLSGFKQYMRVLEEAGVNAMINVLGSEEDIVMRKFIFDNLMELGRGYVHLLGARINDDRWYLVRNLVSLMGRYRTNDALPYLRATFHHENPKVRAETIRALGYLGGYEATDLLMEGLQSPDHQTRVLCVRWLGRLKEKRAVHDLINMLGELRDNRLEDLRLKKEIILSLGLIGNLDAVPVLEKYRKMKKFFYKAEWEEINQAAEISLLQLEKLFPHIRRKRP